MHIDTAILLSIQKHSIMYSRILQKHLLYGCSFPKTKLVFVLYRFSIKSHCMYSPLNAIKGPLKLSLLLIRVLLIVSNESINGSLTDINGESFNGLLTVFNRGSINGSLTDINGESFNGLLMVFNGETVFNGAWLFGAVRCRQARARS